jgi:Flagellar hook-length control protein FliK
LNPAITTNLLASNNVSINNEIQSLNAVSDDLFASEFTAAMEAVLAPDGKIKPLNIAGLNELQGMQLTELAEQNGIPLPPQLLSQLEGLKHQISPQLANQQNGFNTQLPISVPTSLTNNFTDDIKKLETLNNNALKTEIINDDLLDTDFINNTTNKIDTFDGKLTLDAIQQPAFKKEVSLSQSLNGNDISTFLKDFRNENMDSGKDLLAQSSRQEINTVKLVDQLASMDKPLNAINTINQYSAHTNSNPSPTGTMLRSIEVPVQQAGWGDAVGSRLMMMVNNKMQSANIHLNPAELGPIEIRVNVNQDQATVHFISNHAAVRDAVEDAFPRLKEMFMENGLSLTDANVSEQSSKQSHSYSGEEQDSQPFSDIASEELAESNPEKTQIDLSEIGLVNHYV